MRPKLRDTTGKIYELYPLGEIPNCIIYSIGKLLIYHFAVGKIDIDGQDWGDIFASAIEGVHLGSPVGLADVVMDDMAWSVKSVKNLNPHICTKIRVISGRCSPDFSYNISDPHVDIQATGRAVLSIWNERINIAKDKYEPLRSVVLIRDPVQFNFSLYEYELSRVNSNDYEWQENSNGNLEGIHKTTGTHHFTWQPHGSQLTIIYSVPNSAKKFILKKPPVLDFETTMNQIGFNPEWIDIVN